MRAGDENVHEAGAFAALPRFAQQQFFQFRARLQDLGMLNDLLRRRRHWPVAGGTSDVKKAAQAARTVRVRQLPQRLGLDLTDALAGDREAFADLFQRVIAGHADAKAHAHDVLFPRGQARQGLRRDPA